MSASLASATSLQQGGGGRGDEVAAAAAAAADESKVVLQEKIFVPVDKYPRVSIERGTVAGVGDRSYGTVWYGGLR